MSTRVPPHLAPRTGEWAWLAASLLIAILLGRAVVDEMKVALAAVVLFLAVVVPVLVIGVRVRATVLLLVGILYLAPEIRIAADLPILLGDEALLYLTALLIVVDRIVTTDAGRWSAMPSAGLALLLFFPLTILTIANGAARFGINPVRGDYFEFVKFGKYVLALYIASTIRIDSNFLRRFSWGVALGAFVAACGAILQSFDFPGVRNLFETVYYGANPDKVGEYLKERAAGTIGNSNELALFVVAGLVFAIILLQLKTGPGQRAFIWAMIVADIVAIMLSGSRMGLGSALLATILVVLRSGRRGAGSLLLAIGVSSVGLLIFLSAAEGSGNLPGFLARPLQPILTRAGRFDPANLTDIFFRFEMWKLAWSQTQQSLLLGYGPAKGASFLLTSKTVDSEIFIVALRYGLVGMLVWIGIWTSFLRTAARAARSSARDARLVGAALWSLLVVNLLASSVNYTFLAIRRMTLLCIFVGLAAAIVRAEGARERRSPAQP